MTQPRLAPAFALVVVLLTTACGATTATTIKLTTRPSAALAVSALSTADGARVKDNCPDGAPTTLPNWPVEKTEMVYRDGYVLEHSSTWKVPLWVCESLERDELHGKAPRRDRFRADETLTPGMRAELADYKRSGFDRGHQAPAGDQTNDARLKDETFYLSNMIPQNGNQNQQLWATLENMVRGWAEDATIATNVRVLTGPVFHTDQDVASGFSAVKTIGKNAVGVPKAVYKIVVATVGGEQRAVAFLAENRPYKKPFDFSALIVTVEEIEHLTGYDFMPQLAPADRVRLETQKGRLFK